jgi:tryptophan synthase beta chain
MGLNGAMVTPVDAGRGTLKEAVSETVRECAGRLPDSVLACVGGGSNTMGTFAEFLDDEDIDLYAVEAGGSSLSVDEQEGVAPNSASLSIGEEGVLHGANTLVLQDRNSQIMKSYSVSAGLDYAGVGLELASLVGRGRVQAGNVGDDAALEGFHCLSRLEGIIPALETAHAFGYWEAAADELGEVVITNVSGHGDKDFNTVIEETDRRDLDNASEMDVFE